MRRRVAWMHLTQNSQVVAVEGQVLTLGFSNVGARDSFVNGGCDEVLRQAAIDVAGVDWKVESIVDPGATRRHESAAPPRPPSQPPEPARRPAGGRRSADGGSPPAVRPRRRRRRLPPRARQVDPDSDAHRDDPDAEGHDLGGAALLERELGAQVIEEIRHT